ncbi:hypothetical protein [Bradyrhizobium sp. AZCC 1721]|uniref:hypothetical protein n=1 Tax=Bradyrhizobium sp. AZCC 1721 TaxID=3117016 RepID=UPI002FF2448A
MDCRESGGILLFLLFLLRQRTVHTPILSLRLFRIRNFWSGNVATLFIYAALSLVVDRRQATRSMSEGGQSRPGRGNSKSSHVRYAAEDGSRFRALAVTHRHGG